MEGTEEGLSKLDTRIDKGSKVLYNSKLLSLNW